jgi:hypothetical protein
MHPLVPFNVRAATLTLYVAVLLSGCNVERDKLDAQRVADRIHTQQKSGDFQSIYRESGNSFKKEGDEAKFVAAMRDLYGGTGSLKNVRPIAYQSGVDSTVGGVKYVLIFDLEFEHVRGRETITLTRGPSGQMQLWDLSIQPAE